MLTIVILDNEENFIRFLDPELCDLQETIEAGGLRTLEFEYKFQDLINDKPLFQIGNKIWIQGDTNLTDCLYVINTTVSEDVYQKNSFHMEVEEVLVELNYAPVFSQLELTKGNGFTLSTNNGQQQVKVDYLALQYWFGDFFNIGVVQDCLNDYSSRITIDGTINKMNLLRLIEEETGNVFVTRYEKDCLDNTIHRYLDFLNPINVSKSWELNLEYDFLDNTKMEPVNDTYEDVYEAEDIVKFNDDITGLYNIDPNACVFQITDEYGRVLDSDGEVYVPGEGTSLSWKTDEIGLDTIDYDVVIKLRKETDNINISINKKQYILMDDDDEAGEYGAGDLRKFTTVAGAVYPINAPMIPDDSYFEFYDTHLQKAVFRTCINREIGHVHTEVLDFGFNLENIELIVDETETFNSISPVLTLDSNSELTRSDMDKIITNWQELEVDKGYIVPMIVESINVKATSLNEAISSMGTYDLSSNYFVRPLKPKDNVDENGGENTYEFHRATAYWRAPFGKSKGELGVTTDKDIGAQYTNIGVKPDIRDNKSYGSLYKCGNIETTAENKYTIFNRVCLALQEKQNPNFEVNVDVANLIGYEYNNYQLHDKVYIKLPDTQELLTARVSKTSKEAHDVSKNNIELSNYSYVNTIKNIQDLTYIQASNISFEYPNKKILTAKLVNENYNPEDPYSIEYPANKLITFQLYKITDNATTPFTKVYNKLTDANGEVGLNIRLVPGDYQALISFGGDEEYAESSIQVNINISGTVETSSVESTTIGSGSGTSAEETQSKTTTTSTGKTYYSKYGVSPDKKYIMGIGRPSASGELNKYGYKFYKTVFVRKCPMCGSTELYWSIFWAGNETGNWGVFPATGRRESGSAEAQIFCKKCDADYSIFGKNHNPNHKNLTVYKKAVKSSKSEAYTLKKGQMVYQSNTTTNTSKKNTSNKSRTIVNDKNMTSYIKTLALNIVGNSEGVAAAKKITSWFHSNISYVYYENFHRSPQTVLKKKGGNCCDQARALMTLMNAAGCTEHLKLQYVHVSIGKKGHVFCKITTKSTGTWRYVDTCVWKSRNPWGNYVKGYGSPPGKTSNYPNTPF